MKSKIAAIFAVVILALAAAGTAYAAWTASVQINGDLYTGHLSIQISATFTSSSPTGMFAASPDNSFGSSVTMTAGAGAVKAYPGVNGVASITIKNNGNVPAKLGDAVITGDTAYFSTAINFVPSTPGGVNLNTVVLAPDATFTFIATVSVLAGATMDNTYVFTVTIPASTP